MPYAKLDFPAVKEALESRLVQQGREAMIDQMRRLQTALFVMVGGGMLGLSYMRSPRGAYIDTRCGRLPYTRREIEQARKVLVTYAIVLGLDAGCLEVPAPDFHNCGVW